MITRNKSYKRLVSTLLLLVLLFTYSGYSVYADNVGIITEDFKCYLKAYSYNQGYEYPDVWLPDATLITQRFIDSSEGSWRFTMPYQGQPTQWEFFEFRLYNFSQNMLSAGQLQIDFDVKFSSTDVKYLLLYSGNANSPQTFEKPLQSRSIHVDANTWYSCSETLDVSDSEFFGSASIVFACKVNNGDACTVEWSGFNVQMLDSDEDGASWNILRVVRNIWNGIKGLPNSIASAFTGLINNVINTITSAVTMITDFTTALFLPPEGFFNSTSSRFSQLLLNNTGFVGQVVSAVQGLYSTLRNAHPDGTIATIEFKAGEYTFFPSATLNISENGFYQYLMNLPFVQTAFDGSLLFFAILWAYKVISHCVFGILNYNEHLKADDDVNDVIGLGG